MKTVLVPTDFSPNANKALDYAAELAKLSNAEIILLYVTGLSNASLNENVILQEDYDRELMEKTHRQLELLAQAVREVAGVNVTHQVFNGFVEDAIKECAAKNKADLVVMGTVGDAAVKEKLFGSITAAVIGHSDIPVLAIPLLFEWTAPENILLAMNDFYEAPQAVETVFKIAALFNIPVLISVFIDEKNSEAIVYLDNRRNIEVFCIKQKELYPGLSINATLVYGDDFEHAIKSFIANNNVSMLAMLTHKRNFIQSIFHHSMTKKMSYHTDIPLLSIPA